MQNYGITSEREMAIYSYIFRCFISLSTQNEANEYSRTRKKESAGRMEGTGRYRHYSGMGTHRGNRSFGRFAPIRSIAKSKDIDLHIYTNKLDIADSFSVMQELAERLPLKEIQYRNLIYTEEECIEWHALYEDKEMSTWKFDMIHIRKNSKYDGVVERVTSAIRTRLTPEIRKTILQIKFDVPEDILVPGIEIYHAVFVGGVRNYEELEQWRKTNPLTDSLEWLP